MGRWTVQLLKRLSPQKRLLCGAWLFWLSIIGGVVSTGVIASGFYERVLMGISWGAITVSAVDVILTADVRDEEN